MFTKKNSKTSKAISELQAFIANAPKLISECHDLGQYMEKVRAPLNLRLIDLALGISLSDADGKKRVKMSKLMTDEEVLAVTRLMETFVLQMETPFTESLVLPEDGIPLVQGIQMPEVKRNKKSIITMVFKGTSSAAPLSHQLLTAAAVQELVVFGRKFHKDVLRNRILLGVGVTIALVGLSAATYFLVIKPKMAAKNEGCDCDDCGENYGGMNEGADLRDAMADIDAVPIVALA